MNLHFIVEGRGHVLASQGFRAPVSPSTLVVVPPGMGHKFEPDGATEHEIGVPGAVCRPTPTGLDEVVAGRGSEGLVMTCGRLTATYGGALGLFDHLEAPLVESFEDEPGVRAVFERLLVEQDSEAPGAARMTQTLMEQCLIYLFRRLHERDAPPLPWLAALQHPGFARVLDTILDDPGGPHTLDAFAAMAGMSRSVFSERFQGAFGRSAIDLLRETRLRLGARLLQTTDLPVKTIATRVGFASRSHFSRAFKESFGSDPARFRAAE